MQSPPQTGLDRPIAALAPSWQCQARSHQPLARFGRLSAQLEDATREQLIAYARKKGSDNVALRRRLAELEETHAFDVDVRDRCVIV